MRSESEVNRAIENYADMVRRLCMVHLKNYADTEDIFQTVFLKYILYPEPFESEEHEKAWIIRVTINACKDLLKSAWWRRHATLHEASHLAAPIVPEPDDTLYNAVQALPLRYREPVYLFYYEGYDTNEIAQLLHISPATVRKRLCRAREKLKQELEGYCHETLY